MSRSPVLFSHIGIHARISDGHFLCSAGEGRCFVPAYARPGARFRFGPKPCRSLPASTGASRAEDARRQRSIQTWGGKVRAEHWILAGAPRRASTSSRAKSSTGLSPARTVTASPFARRFRRIADRRRRQGRWRRGSRVFCSPKSAWAGSGASRFPRAGGLQTAVLADRLQQRPRGRLPRQPICRLEPAHARTFFALGSGPGRAQARVEKLFEEFAYSDQAERVTWCSKGRHPPPPEVVDKVARGRQGRCPRTSDVHYRADPESRRQRAGGRPRARSRAAQGA